MMRYIRVPFAVTLVLYSKKDITFTNVTELVSAVKF